MPTPDDKAAFTAGHGLYYIDRSAYDPIIYQLDGHRLPDIDRPERDVVKALLRYALDRLDEQG